MRESKRSYGQYCSLARALDVVGDRWNLLIVRELLSAPARYSEIRAGLPGIATNLLATRLRDLEENGVVQRSLAADSNNVVYSLTARGQELRVVLAALVHWGGPLMVSGPQEDVFQPQWLTVALDLLLHDKATKESVTVGLAVGDAVVTVHRNVEGTRVGVDPETPPETIFRAGPDVVLGVASGLLPVDEAMVVGELQGDPEVLTAAFAGD